MSIQVLQDVQEKQSDGCDILTKDWMLQGNMPQQDRKPGEVQRERRAHPHAVTFIVSEYIDLHEQIL